MSESAGLAMVTGAGAGIGRASALRLASDGFAVAVVDLDLSSAEETAHSIVKAGGRSRGYRADVSKASDIDTAMSAAVRDLGPLEVMFNNAGVLDGYFDVDDMDEAVWRRVLDIDLTGVFLGAKRALREMLPRRRGRIINMASVAGLNGTGGGAAYIAAKHGVVGLTKQMAVVYGARGITVNCVCPGAIPTEFRAHSQAILGPGVPDMSGRGVVVNDDQVRALVPAGVRGTVEDIANAVGFLASAQAGYVNGHSLVVDGGWRARQEGRLDHAEVFDRVYRENLWQAGSGTGSAPEATQAYREFLHNFMRSNGVRSVVDLGCGDWQFSSRIDWSGIDYLGIDVSKVVLETVRRHARPGVAFRALNAVTEPLPAADLLIAKDVLQHWSNADIHALLPKFRSFRYVLVTNGFLPDEAERTNAEMAAGFFYRPVDLARPPFEVGGAYVAWFMADEPKYAFLWTRPPEA